MMYALMCVSVGLDRCSGVLLAGAFFQRSIKTHSIQEGSV